MSKTPCLIVIDYQKDFVDGVLGCGQPALGIEGFIAQKIQERIDAHHNVFITLDTHLNTGYASSREGSSYTLHCQKYTAGWLPYGAIKNYMTHPGVEVIEKTTYGSVELAGRLHTGGFRDIEVVGVYTDISVLHNVVLIYNTVENANIRVLASGCASSNATMHQQALRLMQGFATVVE